MALKYADRTHDQALGAANFQLMPDIGRSFVVKRIGVIGHGADTLAEVTIGDSVMMNFPCRTTNRNCAPVKFNDVNNNPFLENLKKDYPDLPYPIVDEGEILEIVSATMTGTVNVEYDEHEGTDRPKKSDPGGSESNTKLFISHGETQVAILTGQTIIVPCNTSLNIAGVHPFPFTENAPLNRTFELIGLCTAAGANILGGTTYTGMRLWKNNEALLAEDGEILPPAYFPYNVDNIDRPIHTLLNPIKFVPNDRLLFEMRFVNAGGAAVMTAHAVVTFFFIERIGGSV